MKGRKSKKYDVIVVGAGPAGIFAAIELVRHKNLKIVMLEKGKSLKNRESRIFGWGGAGAFSDGKLTLSTQIGGQLNRYIPDKEVSSLIEYVDSIYVEFGAPKTLYGTDEDALRELQRKATLADLELINAKIRHLGTERCFSILEGMEKYLQKKVEIETEAEVEEIITEDSKAIGVRTTDGRRFFGDYIVAAPGRQGAQWLTQEAHRLGLKTMNNPVDVGVRVEIPGAIMEHITDTVYEPKLIFYSKSFDDKVRTFCMCPWGEVVTEYSEDVITVNGHSYANKRTDNTNFAILVSTAFTEPFHEPIAYGRYLARLANLISGGIIVQRLGDLEAGQRSTEDRIKRGIVVPSLSSATPGDLSFVLPYRYLADIMEMIKALDKLAPGISSRHTLLYGVEVKLYSSKLKLKKILETEIDNLFAIGDGAGLTRGLIQASSSGVIAAREIINKIKG